LEIFHQSSTIYLALLAVIMPLLSLLWVTTAARRGSRSAILSILASFIFSFIVFTRVWNGETFHVQVAWFSVGDFHLTAGILLNNLSVGMLLLVSGIAFIVHIYSIQYMWNDPYLRRYWRYLSLFCFSMMALVIVDNLLLIYMFWELVGFSSYLLIGFWFARDAAAQAAKKAFLVNRIGDLGFLAGLMIIFTQFRTLDVVQLFGQNGLVSHAVVQSGLWIAGTHQMPSVWLTIAGGAFFMGAIAKSAQFPFHVWLPDAMEGPTSVSSLIHAATMVAAGVFLIARIYPVFDENILMAMVITGTFTAFMAATIALVQNDLKKILAFSTVSQLGFMMLAMGTGAYNAGLFHLATHAFFKCLLFLGAGGIIHELNYFKEASKFEFDSKDIRNMGGLRKYMPVTFITMLVASLALAGIPFTSGYLSKDSILIHAFEWSSSRRGVAKLVPYTAVLTSWITAFYIARLIFKVFYGEFKFKHKIPVLEPPSLMQLSLLALSVFCLFPIFSFNPVGPGNSWIIRGFSISSAIEGENNLHIFIPLIVSAISMALIYFAFIIYVKRDKSREHTTGHNVLYQFVYQQWYVDKVCQVIFVKPVMYLSRISYVFDRRVIDGIVNTIGKLGIALAAISAFFDRYIIDGLINMLGSISKSIGNFTRHFQTGRLQHYIFGVLIAVLTFFLLKYFSQAI
jgi:NADH-quinone oxidoreductase subunit L